MGIPPRGAFGMTDFLRIPPRGAFGPMTPSENDVVFVGQCLESRFGSAHRDGTVSAVFGIYAFSSLRVMGEMPTLRQTLPAAALESWAMRLKLKSLT